MTAETLRWVVLLEGFFGLGSMLALYERVWRFWLPVIATRTFIAAGAAVDVGYIIGLHDRLRDPALQWRDLLAAAALTGYLAGLVSLYRWFRTPDGRRGRHAAIAAFHAARLLRLSRREHEEKERYQYAVDAAKRLRRNDKER